MHLERLEHTLLDPCVTDNAKKTILRETEALAKKVKELDIESSKLAKELKAAYEAKDLILKEIKTLTLAIFAATTIAISENTNATEMEIISAALWDVAKTIDPIFVTDAIEWGSGINED